jgi:hypothetical protein
MRCSQSTTTLERKETNTMEQPNVNNQSSVNETPLAQNGQELPARLLNDLPLTDAQAEAAKAGIVGGSPASPKDFPYQLSLRH